MPTIEEQRWRNISHHVLSIQLIWFLNKEIVTQIVTLSISSIDHFEQSIGKPFITHSSSTISTAAMQRINSKLPFSANCCWPKMENMLHSLLHSKQLYLNIRSINVIKFCLILYFRKHSTFFFSFQL